MGSLPHAARAAVYVRVSTEDQEDRTSLDTQEAKCRAWAQEHGYNVSEAHVYGETWTGAQFHERPRLGQLRQALRDGELDAVYLLTYLLTYA